MYNSRHNDGSDAQNTGFLPSGARVPSPAEAGLFSGASLVKKMIPFAAGWILGSSVLIAVRLYVNVRKARGAEPGA